MRLLSLSQAGAATELSRSQLQRLIGQGKLPCIRSGNSPSAPIYIRDKDLRQAGYDLPADAGEETFESALNDFVDARMAELLQVIAEQRRELAELKIRLRTLEGLHVHHPLATHCLPPQA